MPASDGAARTKNTLLLRLSGGLAATAPTSDYAGTEQPRLSPWLDQALRLDVLRLRLVVLRAAPRADAALRVVFRFFAPPFLFFDVIGMSNDSSCV
jgi:hypothetical protein